MRCLKPHRLLAQIVRHLSSNMVFKEQQLNRLLNKSLSYSQYSKVRGDIRCNSLIDRLPRSPGMSEKRMCSEARRIDLTQSKHLYYLDTHALIKALQVKGFNEEQAEAITQAFVDVLQVAMDYQTKTLVTKAQQEIGVQQMMSHISSIKKDMVILEKSEFSTLRNETEKQSIDIRQLKTTLKDEISKLEGKVTLDVNLERSRAREAHAESEKELQKLDNRIETEVAHLRTVFEQYRNDVLKYAGGTVLTCCGICLGFIRLWS